MPKLLCVLVSLILTTNTGLASYNISQLDLDTDKKDQILNFSRNLLDRQI